MEKRVQRVIQQGKLESNAMEEKGIVFDIMKFAIHDGPGIRTAVFLKGCPLHCLWCHNPESIELKPEISFLAAKCIGCGYCVKACPNDCHKFKKGERLFDRSRCTRCGRCAMACHAQAIEIIGCEMSVSEVLDEVMKDKLFYETSGGGITLSGGEPMMQFEFAMGLMKQAKSNGLSVCLETCGYAPLERFAETLPYVDIYLFDVKETDPARHLEITGAPLEPILKNLDFLNSEKAEIILRCPLIPGMNTRPQHFKSLAEMAMRLESVTQVDVEPYHPLGLSKSERIGKPLSLPGLRAFAEYSEVKEWIEAIKRYCSKPVVRS